MITFLRIIVSSLILYFIYRIYKTVKNIFTSNKTMFENDGNPKKSKYNIDKNDIIEAKFEDITSKDSKKTKENS